MHTHEIVVSGYVQGVGFRSYVEKTASANGIKGEVWNGRDGNVWVIAQSPDEAVLKRFEEELWNGPGRVDDVRSALAQKGAYDWFDVGPTR